MMLIFTNLMVISVESINGDHVRSGPVAYCGDGHGWLDGMGCQINRESQARMWCYQAPKISFFGYWKWTWGRCELCK